MSIPQEKGELLPYDRARPGDAPYHYLQKAPIYALSNFVFWLLAHNIWCLTSWVGRVVDLLGVVVDWPGFKKAVRRLEARLFFPVG